MVCRHPVAHVSRGIGTPNTERHQHLLLIGSASGASSGSSAPSSFSKPQLLTDLRDRLDRWYQSLPSPRQTIFDRGWRCRHDSASYDALFLHLPEPGRQHFRRDQRNIRPKLTESARATTQMPDDAGCPRTSDKRHTFQQRTCGRRLRTFILSHFQGHRYFPGYQMETQNVR